ncbi:MAG: PDZ domain-containing protein [Planctomycetota bacterium]
MNPSSNSSMQHEAVGQPLSDDRCGTVSAASRRRIWQFACIVSLVIATLFSTNATILAQAERSTIDALINKLNDSKYLRRQQAMKELTEVGPAAIEALSDQLVSSTSPEIQWRVKSTLEKIAYSHDAETMYKTTAILACVFPDFELNNVRSKWQREKRSQTIQRLVELGAEVLDLRSPRRRALGAWQAQFGNQPIRIVQLQLQPVQVGNLGIEDLNGLKVVPQFPTEIVPVPSESLPTPAGERDETESDEVKEKDQAAEDRQDQEEPAFDFETLSIEKKLQVILRNDFEANRNLVRKLQQGSSPVNPMQAVYNNTYPSEPDVVLTFSKKWIGQVADLKLLEALDIESVTFKKLDVEFEMLEQVVSNSPSRLTFDACNVESFTATNEAERSDAVSTIRTVEIINHPSAVNLIRMLGQYRGLQINQIRLQSTKVNDEVLSVLSNISALRSLELEQFRLSPKSFDLLKKLSDLRSLTLNKCRFGVTQFNEFKASRPDVNVGFTANAFLGVSGSVDADNELEITRVVEGSAAAVAGIQVGDVIRSVGGQNVVEFEELRQMIAQYGVGDQVEIELIREGESMMVEAKLESNLQEPIVRW